LDDLVAIARIVRPHGLRGELVADLLTDFPERFEGLDAVTVVLSGGERRQLLLEKFRFQTSRIVLKLEGVDSIESAENFRNAEVCVSESEAVDLEAGEFFDWQLQGCRVATKEGLPLGHVREVMRTGGTEILLVDGPEREYMIPFAESICTEVDLGSKLITVDPPEGLLDF
jgi:16S rRNA processing protein RimM